MITIAIHINQNKTKPKQITSPISTRVNYNVLRNRRLHIVTEYSLWHLHNVRIISVYQPWK
ncbi:hypothetical protein TMatcc_009745 [Talaromyces marneffei ATCC 18224]